MLRRIQPKREFSPRLTKSITAAASPFEFGDIEKTLRDAKVKSAKDLTPKSDGSWLDVLESLEVSIGRKLSTFETGVFRNAIDAIEASGAKHPPKKRRVDDSAHGQSSNDTVAPVLEHFFESKYTKQEYSDAEAAILQVAEAFADQSGFIRDARLAKKTE